MLPDQVAGPFRELLTWLANLADDLRDYFAFWGKHHWWSSVFLKEALEGPEELLRLRDQLRKLWHPNVLPTGIWLNYNFQPSGMLDKGIRKVFTEKESQTILDKAESRTEKKFQGLPATARRLIALFKAEETGEIQLAKGEIAELWGGCIAIKAGPPKDTPMSGFRRPWVDAILREWVNTASAPNTANPMFLWQQGRILPDPFNLRLMLALTVADNSKRFAECKNPDCPDPYFLKKRKTQKYCELGECTAYAQRKYALDNWNRVGKYRRKQKQKKKKRKT